MARKTKEDAEATREGVLIAALDLFSEKGYSRTTFADIAKRISMTRGAVYWHFENKPALLAALIEYLHERKERLVGLSVPDIYTVADLRQAFIAHTRIVIEDAITRKFEFFMNFQMEWSEELLTETYKILNEIRESPLEEFKACFVKPAIAAALKTDVNLNQLILTLASFWIGACKMYLGGCPGLDFGHRAGREAEILDGGGFFELIGTGFDLIMSGVLKTDF